MKPLKKPFPKSSVYRLGSLRAGMARPFPTLDSSTWMRIGVGMFFSMRVYEVQIFRVCDQAVRDEYKCRYSLRLSPRALQ